MPATRKAQSRTRHLLCSSMVALGLALGLGAPAAFAQEAAATYNIEGRSLGDALREFGRISGTQIIFDEELVRGRTAPTLRGDYPPSQALDLLLAGTDLRAERTSTGAIMIVDRNWTPQRRADSAAPTGRSASNDDEIIVTGTRTGAPTAAPVRVLGRTDLEQSGHVDIGDVMRSLPENFAGGQNPGIMQGTTSATQVSQNISNSSTVNLRGIGTDATLVLVNGRRLASDVYFGGPDISAIPMPAIGRVEVVTDGSSALYGSDAVAGVVNFILRDDFQGFEVSTRLGGTTEGGGFEQTYGLLGGATWRGGHFMAAGEHQVRDPIYAGDRDFTAAARQNISLIQSHQRNSVFLSFGQNLTDRVEFELIALGSERQAGAANSRSLTVATTSIETQSFMVSPSLRFQLSDDWRLVVDATYGESAVAWVRMNTNGTVGASNWFDNKAGSLEATLSGPLFTLPGGPLQAVIGGGIRQAEFDRREGSVLGQGDRDVTYIFGEVAFPLVTPSDTRFGLNSLDVTIAARAEEYSDFGSTANPKVGIRWVPAPSLVLRGTWGESFKAPSFTQTHNPLDIYHYRAAQLGSSTPGNALFLYGGNTELMPEESVSWTIGFDWTPATLSGLRFSATYFDIDYTDRIVLPILVAGTALTNPDNMPFITWNPTVDEQNAAIARAGRFQNFAGVPYDPANTIAIVEGYYRNASAQHITGVDLSGRYSFSVADESFDLFANASWLEIEQRTLPTQPSRSLTGLLFEPADFRARGGLSWYHGGFTVTGIVNYIGEITDTGVIPNVRLEPWTTVDARIGYRGAVDSPLSGFDFAFAVSNLFDEAPPRARGACVTDPGLCYDGTNHSVIGRLVSATVRKRF